MEQVLRLHNLYEKARPQVQGELEKQGASPKKYVSVQSIRDQTVC